MKCDTIPDLEKFLVIQEQALGPATPEVATTLCKLAELYFAKGNVGKAEQLFQRSVDIRSQLHGLNRQGIEQAEQRLNELRAQKETKPNAPVPSTTVPGASSSACLEPQVEERKPPHTSLSNLAAATAINSAIQDIEIELELLKQMVGAEHPSVADLLTKLADLYCRLRNYGKMEPLLVEALKIREAACGVDHPSVSTELKNLGTLYCTQERYALAEPLLRRAISIRERSYGSMHPRVADVESQYALLLRKTNRAAQAEALERHVNEIRNGNESTLFSCDSSLFGAAVNKPRR